MTLLGLAHQRQDCAYAQQDVSPAIALSSERSARASAPRARPEQRIGGLGAAPSETLTEEGGSALGNIAKCVTPPPDRPARRRWRRRRRGGRFGLRSSLRRYHPRKVHLGRLVESRIAQCGRRRYSSEVAIAVLPGRHEGEVLAHFDGVVRCGSVWACPVCSAQICAERAREVTAAVAKHGAQRVQMLSLTVRHALGDDLRSTARVSDAWRAVCRGEPWSRFKRRSGYVGSIRALEVTHGANGWHPHLHVLLFLEEEQGLSEEDLAWLKSRWIECVARHVGVAHTPDGEHGCVVTSVHEADYIAKLGLEVADPREKSGRCGSRTPWEIAEDLVDSGDGRDERLWQNYVGATHGKKQLTWSANLREVLGLGPEQDDQQIVEGEQLGEQVVARIDGRAWDAVRDLDGIEEALLEAAEDGFEAGGLEGARDAVALVLESSLERAREG